MGQQTTLHMVVRQNVIRSASIAANGQEDEPSITICKFVWVIARRRAFQPTRPARPTRAGYVGTQSSPNAASPHHERHYRCDTSCECYGCRHETSEHPQAGEGSKYTGGGREASIHP